MQVQTMNVLLYKFCTEPVSNHTTIQICLNTNTATIGKLCASSTIFCNSSNFMKSPHFLAPLWTGVSDKMWVKPALL